MEHCSVEGCNKPLDRQGVCFLHRIKSLNFNGMYALKDQRESGMTARQMQREVEEDCKEAGIEIQPRGKCWT